MKQHARFFPYVQTAFISGLITAALSTIPLGAQKTATQETRLGQELEVMKSILSTTLSFLGRGEQSAAMIGSRRGFGVDRIEGIYLRGQGAVFTISVRNALLTDPDRYASIEKQLQRLEESNDPGSAAKELQLLRSLMHEGFVDMPAIAEIAEAQALAAIAEQGGDEGTAMPTPRPAPMVAKKRSPEQIKKDIAEFKQKLVQSRQQAEENRRRIHQALVDVLSRYGDSLTQLSPGEYVNMVVSTDGGFGLPILPSSIYGFAMGGGEPGQGAEMILTVKMSDVRDYRAGRIDLATLQTRIETY